VLYCGWLAIFVTVNSIVIAPSNGAPNGSMQEARAITLPVMYESSVRVPVTISPPEIRSSCAVKLLPQPQ
jgi:hypothetical protein